MAAGFKLSERELLRRRFVMGPAERPQVAGRLAAAENFFAEILADAEKAQALSEPAPAGRLWPWTLGPAAPLGGEPGPLAGLEGDSELNGLKDFAGRCAALGLGAALVGAAALSAELIYRESPGGRPLILGRSQSLEERPEGIYLPRQLDKVLLLAFVREPAIMGMNPGLARLWPPRGWLSWARQLRAVEKMALFIRRGGYWALPAAGGLVLADHGAVLAGLGELGRLGLLISPEYGPNLRLFAILTNYPFELGQPESFGIKDYCESCQRCINECPAKAIGEGKARPGLFGWPVDRRACFERWREKGELCHKCLEVCPYTREPLAGSSGGRPLNPAPL